MAATASASFTLRLVNPHQVAVVDAVQAQLDEQPGPPLSAEVLDDLVVFHGACSERALRSKVGRALVSALGPAGWYGYFRPISR